MKVYSNDKVKNSKFSKITSTKLPEQKFIDVVMENMVNEAENVEQMTEVTPSILYQLNQYNCQHDHEVLSKANEAMKTMRKFQYQLLNGKMNIDDLYCAKSEIDDIAYYDCNAQISSIAYALLLRIEIEIEKIKKFARK